MPEQESHESQAGQSGMSQAELIRNLATGERDDELEHQGPVAGAGEAPTPLPPVEQIVQELVHGEAAATEGFAPPSGEATEGLPTPDLDTQTAEAAVPTVETPAAEVDPAHERAVAAVQLQRNMVQAAADSVAAGRPAAEAAPAERTVSPDLIDSGDVPRSQPPTRPRWGGIAERTTADTDVTDPNYAVQKFRDGSAGAVKSPDGYGVTSAGNYARGSERTSAAEAANRERAWREANADALTPKTAETTRRRGFRGLIDRLRGRG